MIRPLTLLACSCLALQAEPAWLAKLAPRQPGHHQPLPAGNLEFEISWKGIVNSGLLSFDIGRKGAHKPGVVVIQSTGRSMGMGGKFFPYLGHSWSELDPDSLRPRLFTSTEVKGDERVETRSRFFQDRVACRVITRRKDGPRVKSYVFDHAPIYDIGSAILFIRSQKLDPGDQLSLLLHPFDSPYLLNAKVLGKVKHNGTGCLKLSLEMHKIDRETLKLKPYKKIKEPAILWLSDDARRLPLELRAKVFIGDIRAVLRPFKEA